jgi:hypothetical protein
MAEYCKKYGEAFQIELARRGETCPEVIASAPESPAAAAPIELQPQPKPYNKTGTEAELLALMEAVVASPVVKDPLGTDSEWEARLRHRLVDSGLTDTLFTLRIPVSNSQNEQGDSDRVYYAPETGSLHVQLVAKNFLYPAFEERDYLNGNNQYGHYYPLQVTVLDVDTYTASNAMGASIEVLKTRRESFGVVILKDVRMGLVSRPRENLSRSEKVDREVARDVLTAGTLELDVYADGVMLQDGVAAPLFRHAWHKEPKMDSPLDDSGSERFMPVHAVSARLMDGAGNVVATFDLR